MANNIDYYTRWLDPLEPRVILELDMEEQSLDAAEIARLQRGHWTDLIMPESIHGEQRATEGLKVSSRFESQNWSDVMRTKAVTRDDLPIGWEKRHTPEGRAYYVDHNTRKTSWVRPPND